jgi:alpha-galactosidase
VIAVDQDRLGAQGSRIAFNGDADVWAKPLEGGAYAVGLLNRGDSENLDVTVNWSDLGIAGSYSVRDLWARKDLGESNQAWTAPARPHETILLRLTPMPAH